MQKDEPVQDRSMRKKGTKQRIPRVVLLIESSRASGRALLCGIADFVHHRGPWSIYWEPGGLEKAWPVLRDLDADGIILRDVDKLDEVLSFGIPAVVVGHSHSEVPSLVNVVTDSEQIGRLAAQHLIGCGFKNFAFCGYGEASLEATPWSEQRQFSFQQFIEKAGFLRPSNHILSMGSSDWSKQLRLLANWLSDLPKPVGLMACNDDCGRIVMEACKLAHLNVPDTVGVVGADNDEVVCGLSDPPISSIAINFERAGYETAQALLNLMARKPGVARNIQVSASHVVARRSTDFVAAEEANLAKALRFIRDRARGPLSVQQVANASGFSRRTLEKRFREVVGRSILDEIRRVRTDQIAQLLVETEMPVSRIAELLGFDDVQHVARYFRSAKSLSPLAFRKSFSKKV